MSRNRRGIRQASMKARVGIAAAVLVGGGAIGAVAVAAGSNSAPQAAQSAGFSLNFHHQVSMQTAVSSALNTWSSNQGKSLTTLAEMAPMKNFSTVSSRHTTYAMQRGVVALANKHWLLVKSANGALHLWLTSHGTAFKNVAGSTTGTAAMTGSASATTAAMQQGNMAPAAATMAGTSNVAAMNATPKPVTFTVSVAGTNETLTITITPSTATVMPSTTSVAQQTGTSMTSMTKQPVFAATNHVARGDLVMVTGVERNHFLFAQLVLFSAPTTTTTPTTPTAPASSTATGTTSTSPTSTVTPTVTPTTTTSPAAFGGHNS